MLGSGSGPLISFNTYGDMPSLEERIQTIVDNYNDGKVSLGIQPTPDSPTAPKRFLGDTINKLGAYSGPSQLDGNFIAIGSAVVEDAIVNDSYVDRSKQEVDARRMYEPKKKDVSMFETPVESGSTFKKTALSTNVGYRIAQEYERAKSGGTQSKTDITADEAAVLGDSFIELYAKNHPDLIESVNTVGMSNVNKSKLAKIGYFKVTERGSEVFNADMKKRNALFPDKLLRTSKKPTGVKVGNEVVTGVRNVTGKVKPKDMTFRNRLDQLVENLGSIPQVVNIRRAKILLMTIIPALKFDPSTAQGVDTNESVGAEINKIGSDKLNSIRSEIMGEYIKDNKDINDPSIKYDIERVARQRLDGNKKNIANQLLGISTEREGANYLDYYVSSFNYRVTPLQTLFDPVNFKTVRFVTTNIVPVTIKVGNLQEKAIRQMYAMSLVDGADMKLPDERERLLKENHKVLYEDGKVLRGLVDEMSNQDLNDIMDAIANIESINSEVFTKIKGLGLNPSIKQHADLLEKIKSKGEDGNAYIDGLIDYANYYESLYKNNKSEFKSFFNAFMDGKTNGLASAAMILGLEAIGYKTGVLRESSTDLLDSGDIRDDVADKLKDHIESGGVFSIYPETEANSLKYIATHLIKYRKLHKDTTMTFGYGMDPVAFSLYIDDAINNIEASGEAGPLFTKHLNFLRSSSNVMKIDGLGTGISNAINIGYTQAVIQSLSADMIEARTLLSTVGMIHALTDEPYIMNDPVGNPLFFGGFKMQEYEDAFQANYTMYDDGKVTRKKAVRYSKGDATSSVPKSEGGEPGKAAIKSVGPGVMQSVDAATVTRTLTGKSWDKISKASKGNPYVQPIYDAFKVDANSYFPVLEEVNKNWAEITMNYNHISEAKESYSKLANLITERLKGVEGKVDITKGSDFQMIGFLIQEATSKKGNKYYPTLNKMIAATGVLNYLLKTGKRVDDYTIYNISKKIINKSGLKGKPKEISPEQIWRFVSAFAQETRLMERLNTLEKQIDTNKKQMYPKIAKQTKNGRWIATADDIFQYYSH
jgi:tetrahydromethanopterin S-methyltransferase subunit G